MKKLLTWLVAGILFLFTLRRWLFTLIALLPDLPAPEAGEGEGDGDGPEILLLVPIRNEAQALPDLLAALDWLTNSSARANSGTVCDRSMM